MKNYRIFDTQEVNDKLLAKGWEVMSIEKGDDTHYTVARWSLKDKDGYFIAHFEHRTTHSDPTCVYCNSNYDVFNSSKEIYLNYKKQISSSPKYKKLTPKVNDGEISDYYWNEQERIIFKFKILQQNETTFYIIECHKSGSILMIKEVNGLQ
jgi:hypothetical protein